MYGPDHWEVKHRAAWPPWPSGVPTKKRGWPHGCVRPPAFPRRPSPPPSSRATRGGYEGGGGGVRGRREAEVAAHRRRRGAGDRAERVELAGGNAAAVAGGLLGDGAEGVPGSVVARESRASGGNGEFGRKRGLSPPAACPHPKRRAVSASRQFPPGCGRDSAVPIVRTGGDDDSPVGDTPSHGGFSIYKQSACAPPSCSGATEEGGLLLEPATANAGFCVPEKFVAVECGAPTAGGYHHGPESTVVKSLVASVRNAVAEADGLLENGAQGVAGLVVGRGGAPWSGELGRNDSMPIPRLPLNSKMVCAKLCFPHGCRTDFVARVNSKSYEVLKKDALDGAVPGQEELEEGEVAVAMDIVKTLKKDAWDGAVAGQEELEEGEVAVSMDIVKTLKKNALDGAVAGQEELEEGEIAATMFIVEAVKKGELEGAVAGQEELEEGEVAVAMDIVKTLKKNALGGAVAGQEELEEGEIAATMYTVEAVKKGELEGAVECQELEEGEIAATMDIVEARNKHDLDGAVLGLELEQSEIAATGGIVEAMNKHALDGLTKGLELKEGEIASTMDIVENMNKDYLYEPIHDQKLEGDITAKGHGSELVEHEIAAESDHIIQESQVSVDDVIPHDFIAGNTSATESDHIFQGFQVSVNVIPRHSIAGIMRSKIRLTPRKSVRPPVKAIHKSLPVTPDRSITSVTEFFSTIKKFKSAQSKHLAVNVSSTSLLASEEKHPFKFLFVSKEKLKDKGASHLEDDDILKAVAVHKGKLELYLNVPSCGPSIRRHSHNQGQKGDARSKVRMLCSRFQFLCRFLVQAVEQRLLEVWRIDLAADKVIRNLPGFTKHGSIVGKVPGVEVGDEFRFRVELAIVGLHRPYRGGIDTTKETNGVLIAISIVASGGYPGELSSSGELIYTGSGGKAAGKEHDGDQKLERGNLALKNCIKTKTPVRVIHGFKGQNRKITTFAYDGMYLVVDCWWEGLPGSRVIKYRLQRISGQAKLPLHIAKWLPRSVVRPGLCIAGISQGKERVPIRLKNNADNVRPDCHTRD